MDWDLGRTARLWFGRRGWSLSLVGRLTVRGNGSTRFNRCVSRQAGAFSKVARWSKSEWTNGCRGSPARLQMRREALCASGSTTQHQVAPAAAAIRQVDDQSFPVSRWPISPSPHPLRRARTRRRDRGCESSSQEIRVSEECTNIITAPVDYP